MNLRQSPEQIAEYTIAQLAGLFPLGKPPSRKMLRPLLAVALERLEFCFRHIAHPAYSEGDVARFDVLNSDQYCQFLYFLANTAHVQGGSDTLPQKLFCLNKALHAFNCMYDTELPPVFWVIHAVGTVLGKAHYGNFLVVRQNCTVGAIRDAYPVIGDRLVLSAGASVIGRCRIGRNVMIGPGCCVLNADIPDDTLVTTPRRFVRRANSPRAFSTHFRES